MDFIFLMINIKLIETDRIFVNNYPYFLFRIIKNLLFFNENDGPNLN